MAILRIDHAALARGGLHDGEVCEIAGLGPVPVSTARELLGDAVLKLVVTKGVDVVNVTSLGRGPTTAQRIALAWQQPECSALGCPHRHTEIDHRQPWHQVHETRLGNLDPLCTWEHYKKTVLGWALVEGTGKRPFVAPTDPRHPNNTPKPTPTNA